jgi:S-DNA-T family DNA segregation ATPase FtsK/SpoIIIE
VKNQETPKEKKKSIRTFILGKKEDKKPKEKVDLSKNEDDLTKDNEAKNETNDIVNKEPNIEKQETVNQEAVKQETVNQEAVKQETVNQEAVKQEAVNQEEMSDSKKEDEKEVEKNNVEISENKQEEKEKSSIVQSTEENVEVNKNNEAKNVENQVENVDENKKKHNNIEYKFPEISFLSEPNESSINTEIVEKALNETAQKLEDTLMSFGVEAKVINRSKGPAVTRYEISPKPGIKVSKILGLSDDISLSLATSGIRIEAPIPGKSAIGIEVPNKYVSAVNLKEVIDSSEFKNHASKLAFAVGKDISGDTVVGDISKMPHMLIAGATGSGKSVCINSIILSVLYKAEPDKVKLLMIDPKVVELGIYNGIPHLLVPVVTDPKKAANALRWAVEEMTDRYKKFANKGVRDIRGYNESVFEDEGEEKLPQIIIIIDELADLMMVASNDVEDSICRLAQMARAAGMHLVIATQRPSVDVITGIIKANIPSRIAFSVSSQVDSRTILDMVGAEKLLGKGDMLFYPIGEQKPIRVKGAFVSDKEVEKIVNFLKTESDAQYSDDIIKEINSQQSLKTSNDTDELLSSAIELVVDLGQASTSMIQRKFKVGYNRAARIIEQMEERDIIGKFDGSKPRQVLITKDEFNEMIAKNG